MILCVTQIAYNRGVKATKIDFKWHWRVHTDLWTARVALKLKDDYVECRVGKALSDKHRLILECKLLVLYQAQISIHSERAAARSIL